MTALFLLARKSLAHRPLRSVLAVIAIMLGTAVAAAAFTINASIEESLRAAALTMVGNADLVVESQDVRGFPLAVVPAAQALAGVRAVAPQARKRVFYRYHHQGEPANLLGALRARLFGATPPRAEDRGFVELVGIDPQLDPRVHDYRLAAGRFFNDPNEAGLLLVRDWAQARGIRVGDSVELVTGRGFEPFPVVGLLDEADLSQRNYGGLVRIPLGLAQSSFGMQDRVHLLSVQLDDPGRSGAVAEALASVIPQLFVVKEVPRLVSELQASAQDFQVALLFFAALALVLGAVQVFNTLSLATVEQRHEIRLLRAGGATRMTMLRLGLVQGLLLGVSGGLVGVVVGQGLALGLTRLVGAVQGIPTLGPAISWTGVALSLLLGVLVTLFASIVPALLATGRYPLPADDRDDWSPSVAGWLRRSAVAAILLAALLAPPSGEEIRALKLVALALLFPMALYLSRPLIPRLAGLAALPLRPLDRAISLMVARNLRRERVRTSLAVTAFVVSLSLIVALANSSASMATAGQEWAQSLFPGELLVVSPVDQPVELVSEFQRLTGVEQVAAVSVQPVVWAGLRLTVAGIDPAHYVSAFQLRGQDRTSAFIRMRRGGAVLIPTRLAADEGVRVGDQMPLRSGEREALFTVAGVIPHSFPAADNYGALIVAQRDLESAFEARSFRFLVVQPTADADRGRLQRELGAAAELFGMESTTIDSLREAIGRGVGGLLGLLVGLVAVGVLVGGLGAATAVVMNVLLRGFEIGVLRAYGLTERQAQILFVGEAAATGFVGAALGVVLGTLLTRILVDLNRTPDFDPVFTFSLAVAVQVLLAGTAVAAMAASVPTRSTARQPIVELLAISY